MQAKELLEHILSSLVNKPEDLSVDQTTDNMGILLSVRSDKKDMGNLIGKNGKTIQAVRYVIRVAGMREGARISVKLVEDN